LRFLRYCRLWVAQLLQCSVKPINKRAYTHKLTQSYTVGYFTRANLMKTCLGSHFTPLVLTSCWLMQTPTTFIPSNSTLLLSLQYLSINKIRQKGQLPYNMIHLMTSGMTQYISITYNNLIISILAANAREIDISTN